MIEDPSPPSPPSPDQPAPQCLGAVGIFQSPLDQVHDGFTLAAYLNRLSLGCTLRRFWLGTPRGLATKELVEATPGLVFLSAGEENLQEVLALARLLERRRRVLLFGRHMADDALREHALESGAAGVIVGDPRPVARDLLRRMGASGGELMSLSIPGLQLPGEALVPREPPRHLDAFPPGDYSYEQDQVAMAVPLRASLGFPFPATFLAERVWEAPLRGVSPERTLEQIRLHIQEHGARQFVFTDLAANAAGDDLIQLARGIVDQGLDLFWYASIWPSPALNRDALNLLRRSGCRGLRLLLWTGSVRLSNKMRLGVDPGVALDLCEDALLEGIPMRPLVQVGFPGEDADDRIETMAWLSLGARDLLGLDELSRCLIRTGATMRQDPDLVFPAQDAHRSWHDGGENNDSKRAVWLREARTVCGRLGLRHQGEADRQFSAMVEPAVRRRLVKQVGDVLAAKPAWRRRQLLLAGVLHGREAFCGPEELHLDLDGMETEAALGLVEQAAAMGTRRIVLGSPNQPGAAPGPDALNYPGLERLLKACWSGRLSVALCTRLDEAGRGDPAQLPLEFNALKLSCRDEEQLAALEQPVSRLAAIRAGKREHLPRLDLTAWIGPSLPSPTAVAEAADRMGVDRLTLRSVRDAGELLDEAGRVTARDELEALIALTLSPSQDRDQLLLQRAGPCWPDGFRLETGARDKLRSTCPAGKEATEVVSHAGIPGLHLACYGQASCQLCGNLRDCPVSRLDFTVPLQPLLLEGAGILHTDLEDSDMGLGRADRAAERRPCLAGWESAKINSSGDLFICPSCGVEPVGNVLADTLAGIWYSRGLNEFRRMSVGASLALPYIDRNRCAMGCCRRGRDLGLVTRIRSLAKEQLTALEGVGAGDRR